ncbi:glycosyl transferase GTB-type super family [Candidatus Termititenax aidoneus]|uniref:Glycosyl transferase GTB-type super family n=1 Tax=Termititenax aidoneus TaxID=2218524 RepID=A0A388TD69_TERA1|nr:glycosyl transferase GTB-type super family [Candidatus Termititenax aidoneus]
MKIHLYTESFKPYLSGVTVSVDTYARGLAALGHEVTVIAPWYPDFQDDDVYRVLRFPSLGTRLYPGFRLALPVKRGFGKWLRENKPDIIHSHSPYQLGFLARHIAKKMKIPFVYHFHTLFTDYLHFVPLPRFISRPVLIGIIKNFCRRCDLIITPTAIVQNILRQEYGVAQRIEALPTGVDDAAVQKADPQGIREKYGLTQDILLLMYCGRLSKEKNIEFLLKMFQKVSASVPAARLMIVAFGPLEAALKKLAADLKIADRVIFTGRVERARVYDYLKAGDLFVCASKTETQGLVISEAKACGKPAVAIDARGVSQMIENGVDGYLTPDDLAVFSQKVVDLLQAPAELRRLADGAERNAKKSFLNSAITKKLEILYNSLK